MPGDHAARVEAEIKALREYTDIHALPGIFHYWSESYLAPMLKAVFGSNDLNGIFAGELQKAIEATGNPQIVSIGAGDGSVEIAIARKLRERGFENFLFECLELSPDLIARGETAATRAGMAGHIVFSQTDLTTWRPQRPFGAVFAHHSLHHIVALEHVFDQAAAKLARGGVFVTSDMIGRNGHMRWPEALDVINGIWRRMPARYRYNHQLKRVEETYENWDCSGEGFEGIRAQDIMPLLLKRFHMRRMCAWGGLIDLFTERSFGHNLDPASAEDRAFIDEVWAVNQALLRAGLLTPTCIIAVMSREPGELVTNGLQPDDCVRLADLVPA